VRSMSGHVRWHIACLAVPSGSCRARKSLSPAEGPHAWMAPRSMAAAGVLLLPPSPNASRSVCPAPLGSACIVLVANCRMYACAAPLQPLLPPLASFLLVVAESLQAMMFKACSSRSNGGVDFVQCSKEHPSSSEMGAISWKRWRPWSAMALYRDVHRASGQMKKMACAQKQAFVSLGCDPTKQGATYLEQGGDTVGLPGGL
jgi:hypothetical protein